MKKDFNEGNAMDEAMKLFWQKGFEATTIDDLLSATGLSKQHFHKTFGSKDALYLAAFHYHSF